MFKIKCTSKQHPFDDRQKKACDLYLITKDARLSVKKAGYAKDTIARPSIVLSSVNALDYLKSKGMSGQDLIELEKIRIKRQTLVKKLRHDNKKLLQEEMPERFITPMQQKLCDAYLILGNIRLASQAAGYVECSAYASFKKPNVQRYLKGKQNMYENDLRSTFEWKVNKLVNLVESVIDKKGKVDRQYGGMAIAAIKELNAMQGHIAPTSTIVATLNNDTDIQKINELTFKILEEKRNVRAIEHK